ncbi:hypothetical protein A9264_14080 [Vibrio sp. UCD-FRSSP16_10]|uniref:hypothetical protein n=1 Tax=unclassified Vibrio TaxID=2614977 RepID=UPI0007FEBCE1|nr:MULTISPECIES: hypothetical protein [unclassified Vibrio]OBT13541.1 hypothetical protein A9260_14460 [Vibrio sp. UCD-FRSSP16_30]OBT20000.1 hypothetical protein A9264_14080 [Vibrio sp. UCD-FRSSP16_10]
MDAEKLSNIGQKLFNYEIGEFLIGVSSGRVVPVTCSPDWLELKRKAQSNQLSESDIRMMVEMSSYEPLALVYEFMDELEN